MLDDLIDSETWPQLKYFEIDFSPTDVKFLCQIKFSILIGLQPPLTSS